MARPTLGLKNAKRPKDKLSQFVELRRAFYHCLDLIKELEEDQDPETLAQVFARAARRLAIAADDFAEPPARIQPQ